MSKIKKLRYFHDEIMVLSEQLIVLSRKIEEIDNIQDAMILAGLSNRIAKAIHKFNHKTAKLYNL